jgi:AcrR family transcriptional regulator
VSQPRRGRRPGTTDTRAEVLAAARDEFATNGYDGASVRGIARAAGVDPALVHHYFGSKEQVFVAAMQFPIDPATELPQLMAGGPDELAERFVRLFLGIYDDPVRRKPFLAMLRSALSSKSAAAMVRQFIARALLPRLAGTIDAPDRELRATLAASHMLGY